MTKTQQQQTRYTFTGVLLVNILTKDAAAAARPRLPSQLSSGGKQALHFAKMQSEKLLGFLGCSLGTVISNQAEGEQPLARFIYN